MSKKPRQSRHRAGPPPWHAPRSTIVPGEYEREVELSGERLQSAYNRARKRAEAADRRKVKAEVRAAEARTAADIAAAAAALELARQAAEQAWLEFERFDRLMRAHPGRTDTRRVRRSGREDLTDVPAPYRPLGRIESRG